MPFNGAGTFTLVAGNPVVTGTVISSTVNNNTNSDFATGFTTCVTKDGQTTPTANLPMGGFKHTSVADATARTQYASLGQLQDASGSYVATVGGTADVITLTTSPAITAYAAGQVFRFIASGANTTSVTVNVSGLGAKNVTKNGATALAAGDIPSAAIVEITYDGTQFQITKIKQGTASVQDTGTSGAVLGLLNTNNTHSGTNYFTASVTTEGQENYAAASGTDTYTASLSPAIASYVTGAHYYISFTNANTSTTPTLNLNSLGAKTIVTESGAALVAGNIAAGGKYVFLYNGTTLNLLNKTLASSGADVQTFNANGTWTKPSNYASTCRVLIQAWGGGGSGSRGALNTSAGGGGGGGGYNEVWLALSALGATETVTIGAGGAAVSVNNTAGNAGGTTTFGSWLSAFGGAGGAVSGTGGGGGGGGGALSAGTVASGLNGGAGGNPNGGAGGTSGVVPITAGFGGGGGAYRYDGSGGGQGAKAVYGGGGGGGGNDGAGNATSQAGGTSVFGGGGGGGGACSGTAGNGGTSSAGGNGGAGSIDTNTATSGTQPGGGGGGTEQGTTGAGADGRVTVTVFV